MIDRLSWLRERLRPRPLATAIALAWLAFAIPTLSSYGLTSDSPALFYAGDHHLFWLLHPKLPGALDLIHPDVPSFQSKYHRFPAQDDPVQYPVFPGLVAAVSNGIFHVWLGRLGETDGHHLGLVLLQAVNLYIFTLYAISLFGLTAGASAAFALAFFPSVLGHAMNNAKDLPCAMFYGSALMAGARGLLRRRPRDLLTCGLLAGFGLACKINAAFALVTLVLWTPVVYALVMRRQPWGRAGLALFGAATYVPLLALLPFADRSHPFVMAALGTLLLLGPLALDAIRSRGELSWGLVEAYRAIPLIAIATSIALWPWLWAGQALTFWERLALYGVNITKFAESARATFTAYPLRCVAYMTPPFVLLLALVGLAVSWRPGREKLALWALLLAWLALPLLRVALPHSMFYDANRHFLETIPPLCLLAGLGFEAVLARLLLLADARARRVAVPALVGFCLLALAIPIALYHPYEVTYFNWLAGGLGGAQRNALLYVPEGDWRSPGTEGDYWHTSLRDFLNHVDRGIPLNAAIGTCGTHVVQAIDTWEGAPLDFKWNPEEAQVLYVSPRENFCGWAHIRDLERQRPVLWRVERDQGLIYEALGPPADHPLEPSSPHSRYENLPPLPPSP